MIWNGDSKLVLASMGGITEVHGMHSIRCKDRVQRGWKGNPKPRRYNRAAGHGNCRIKVSTPGKRGGNGGGFNPLQLSGSGGRSTPPHMVSGISVQPCGGGGGGVSRGGESPALDGPQLRPAVQAASVLREAEHFPAIRFERAEGVWDLTGTHQAFFKDLG